MMKRAALFAVLGTLASMLVAVGFAASPASAITCNNRSDLKTSATHGGNPDSIWLLDLIVNYRQCTTQNGRYARIQEVRVRIRPQQGRCGGVDQWRVNPDTVADWNPGAREVNCSASETRVVVFDAPPNHDAWPGDTANQRCVSGYVTAVRNLTDWTTDLPIICII